MIEQVKTYVKQCRLIDFDRPLAVGVSGGADSVALLHLLHSWQIPVIALHCNFHLRAEESERDCRFVESLCHSWDIPCEIIHFDTQCHAQERGISLEMAARELRYNWFESRRQALSLQAIAVAHHQDDRKETILLNLLRGTGIRGLLALHPRQGDIVRPLLSVKQRDILQYCKDQKLQYVDDSTNFESICQRNRIRLELLPLMESIASGAGDRLLRMADQLEYPLQLIEKEVKTFIRDHVETTPRYTRIPIKALLEHSSPKDLLFELLRSMSFKSADLDDIFRSFSVPETKQFFTHTHRVVKEREMLYLTFSTAPEQKSYTITDCSENNSLPLAFKLESFDHDIEQSTFVADRSAVLLDRDRLTFPLILRPIRRGDRFAPINMKGHKRVSDYLKDSKMPLLDRENVWVITSVDTIVWLVGCRADDRFKVTEQTRHLLKISLLD